MDSPETGATGSPENDGNDKRGVQVPSATVDHIAIIQAQLDARNDAVTPLLATVQSQARALEHAEERTRQLEADTPAQRSSLHYYGAAIARGAMPVLIGVLAGFFGWIAIRVDWGSVVEVVALAAVSGGATLLFTFARNTNDRLARGQRIDPRLRDPVTWAGIVGTALVVIGALFS